MLDFDLTGNHEGFSLRIAFRLESGWLGLLGSSGAGKTQAIDLLAGLLPPVAGFLKLDGKTLYHEKDKINLPIEQRKAGAVLSGVNLFPHLTLAGNLAYGVPAGVDPGSEVMRWLHFFHLEKRVGDYPSRLSRLQTRQAELARVAASAPKMLLLDDLFSGLDLPDREILLRDLLRLKETLPVPTVFTTSEAPLTGIAADYLMVIESGKMVEAGKREEIFYRPHRSQTAHLTGVDNILPVRILPGSGNGETLLGLENLTIRLEGESPYSEGETLFMCIRPQDVRIASEGKDWINGLSGNITRINPLGGFNQILFSLDTAPAIHLKTLVDDFLLEKLGLHEGGKISVWLPPDKIFLCI